MKSPCPRRRLLAYTPAVKPAALAAFFILANALPGSAQQDSPAPKAVAESGEPAEARAARLIAGLHPRTGAITLGDGLAQLKVPDNFQYLGPEDTETVLVQLWDNPPSRTRHLGLITPADIPLSDARSWAAIISYEERGYVKDADADKIDYNDLLKKMQQDTADNNPDRIKNGYPSMTLVGWAAPPRYDKAAKKLYWAQELKIGNYSGNTLNYDVRMLGRRGMLVITSVAAMNQFAEIEAATPQLLAMVDFKQGNRYADFDPKTDKVAEYGIAALIAGGIAVKAGLFKGLWIALLAGKKFVIIAFAAVAAWIKKLFGSKSQAGSGPSLDKPV